MSTEWQMYLVGIMTGIFVSVLVLCIVVVVRDYRRTWPAREYWRGVQRRMKR